MNELIVQKHAILHPRKYTYKACHYGEPGGPSLDKHIALLIIVRLALEIEGKLDVFNLWMITISHSFHNKKWQFFLDF